jgi:hypothetical protein
VGFHLYFHEVFIMIFCQDADLLYWNSAIFIPGQIGQLIVNATGSLSGNVITSTLTPDLVTLDVQAGQVVTLAGVISGQFPILSVTSTTLTFSLLSSGLYPDDGSNGTPIPPYIDSGTVTYTVRTFWSYRRVISDQLLAAAGVPIAPVNGASPTILNPQDFKRACAMGTLAMAYTAVAANQTTDISIYTDRATMYSMLFTQAVRSICAELDWNGDGKVDEIRNLGEIRLHRV